MGISSHRTTLAHTLALPLARALALPLALSLALAGCSKPDEAALRATDAAFKGQVVDGVLTPVASRAVMTGLGGPRVGACAVQVAPRGASANVYWSDSASGPVKTVLTGPALSCQRDGDWTGIVLPGFGQSPGDCNLARRLRTPLEYQGPCRWGWVQNSAIKPAG